MRRRVGVAVLLFSCFGIAHASGTQTSMSVTLDGRKVGKLLVEREIRGDEVVTSHTFDLRVSRGKSPMSVHNELVATEDATGQPRAFHVRSLSSAQETLIDGQRRNDGMFQVTTLIGGQETVSLLAWPEGSSLSEGQRLAFVKHGFVAGTRYQVRNFDPSRQQVATLDVEVLGDEAVELPGGSEKLHHLRQIPAGGDGKQQLDLWVDDEGSLRKSLSPMLGFHMETVACDAACADAPDQDIDVLRSSMVLAPRAMGQLRNQTLRYTLTVKGDAKSPFANTGEQQVEEVRNGVYDVTIGKPEANFDDRPTPEEINPNPWVQSNAPEIVALANKVVGSATSDLQRMQRLRSFLSSYIDETALDIGYASALETLQTRRGDCTEHAVLLAALGRSLAIPTRIVTGLVYTDRFAGASRVFVPHTWVQARIGDRWMSFDSAQRGFDATHIALGVGGGDPWRFFAAMASLGQIQIDRVDRVGGPPTNLPPPIYMREPQPELNNPAPVSDRSGEHSSRGR